MPIIDYIDKSYFVMKAQEEKRLADRRRELESMKRLGLDSLEIERIGSLERAITITKKIDYQSILELAREKEFSKSNITRLAHHLSNRRIERYIDLRRHTERILPPIRKVNGIRTLKIKGLGSRGYSLLYQHLNSLGINLFYTSYNSKELGK